MKHHSPFYELIQQFGHRVGLADMKLDKSGLCRVVLENVVNLDFELSDDGHWLYLYSALPHTEPKLEEALKKALLAANYALHRTTNCRFSYDENANEYVLIETIWGEGLTLDRLDEILQNFARTATLWNSNCRKGEFTTASEQHAGHEHHHHPHHHHHQYPQI